MIATATQTAVRPAGTHTTVAAESGECYFFFFFFFFFDSFQYGAGRFPFVIIVFPFFFWPFE